MGEPGGRLSVRFWMVFAATTASGLGDGLVLVAFPLLATALTDDPRLVVGVAVAAQLPWLLVSLPAGAWVDRVDRRLLVARVEVARSLAVAGFAVLVAADKASLPLLFAVVFVVGSGQTVVSSGTFAALPAVVAPGLLGKANGYLLATETATENVIGPAIGGIVLGAAAALPFVVDGATFAVSAVLLFFALPRRDPAAAVTPSTHWRADLAVGWRWFRGHALLRRLTAVIAVLAFCQAMVLAPLVLFALRELGLSKPGYGALLAVAAVGNVVGGMVAGPIDRRFEPALVLAGAAIVSAAGYLLVGVAAGVAMAALGLAIEAIAVSVGNVTSVALRQRLIPDELLGRVGNIVRSFIFGVIPIGAMVGGVLANQFLRAPVLAAAIIQLAATAVLMPGLGRFLRTAARSSPVPAPLRAL